MAEYKVTCQDMHTGGGRGRIRRQGPWISFLALYFVYISSSLLHITVPQSEFNMSLASFPISLHQAT